MEGWLSAAIELLMEPVSSPRHVTALGSWLHRLGTDTTVAATTSGIQVNNGRCNCYETGDSLAHHYQTKGELCLLVASTAVLRFRGCPLEWWKAACSQLLIRCGRSFFPLKQAMWFHCLHCKSKLQPLQSQLEQNHCKWVNNGRCDCGWNLMLMRLTIVRWLLVRKVFCPSFCLFRWCHGVGFITWLLLKWYSRPQVAWTSKLQRFKIYRVGMKPTYIYSSCNTTL